MKPACRHLLTGLFLIFCNTLLAADEISDIDNYLQYDPYFSSSGQPSAGQLKALSAAGFKRVVYLAFTDNKTAIESEDRVVRRWVWITCISPWTSITRRLTILRTLHLF